MHVHFEQNTCTRTDSNLLSLSWMGKVPEDLPEEGSGWKLNRAQYYIEGWLASGNARGVVGVTFSTSHCHTYDAPPRSNFNLRGHRSEVVLVRWNEPYQKLATCDSRGVIFVWIKHEGRWSIELINDRNSQVTDFAWSHDGRMALICYRDGFILVGSVAGQRYWSSMLNLENNTSVTCGLWSPDDQQVMFGTVGGQIIVMSSAGALVTQVAVHEGFEIISMAWSCEKFNMEEGEAGKEAVNLGDKDDTSKSNVLAVCFKYGDIFLMSGYDDICPVMIYTTLTGVKIDWSNCGEYLAVGGFVRLPNLQCRNELHLYSKDGSLIRWINVPTQGTPLTALTWGHNDKRLFLAAGCHLYVAWVSKQVVPLQFVCQRVIHQSVRTVKGVDKLPLPERLRCGVKALFSPTIKSYIPDPLRLRDFVCSPPPGGERLFCTMIRHGEENSGGHYTLYLEYLGGLVPLLKGKRASKLRPDFIIYDPKIKSLGKVEQTQAGGAIESDASSESDTDVYTDGCGSPRMQRRRKHKVFRAEKVDRSMTFRTLDELMFDDNLPETNRLVEVTSNIWGTKFQIIGVASSLPACLGQVVYKTSLLHLQPRQMTITIMEISPSRPVLSRDPNFTPAPHSTDDEDDFWTSDLDLAGQKKTVEVTVHDVPSLQSHDSSCKVEGSVVDGGRRSVSMDSPLIEYIDVMNGEINPTGKLCSSGTVRSRSLSPVWNSLTQTSSVLKQEGISSDTKPETNGSTGWQGARPKSQPGKLSSKTRSPNSNSRSNVPNSSPRRGDTGNARHSEISSPRLGDARLGDTSGARLNDVNNQRHSDASSPKRDDASSSRRGHNNSHKRAALSSSGHCNSHSSFQYANTSGVMTHTAPTNRVKSYQSSPPATVKSKIQATGFKRFDVGNCVDKAILSGISNEGVLKCEESISTFRDHTLSQNFSGSGAGSVIIPLVDTVKGEGPRWADPASPIAKLLEDGVTEISNIPSENNLVADCSPTAPNCLDLHRRLYLAQQYIVDTGTPISPSNCPSCLPIQNVSDTEASPNLSCLSPLTQSDNTAYNNLWNCSDRLRDGSSVESRLTDDRRNSSPSGIIDSSAASASPSTKIAQNLLQSESTVLRNVQALALHRDQPQSSLTFHRDHLLHQSTKTCKNTSGILQQIQPQLELASDSNISHQNLLETDAVQQHTSFHDDSMHQLSAKEDQNNQPQQQNLTFSSNSGDVSIHQTQEKHKDQNLHQQMDVAVDQFPDIPSKAPISHVHSQLSNDLSSFDKLNLILSEDPLVQNSAHNFRSMPGFVMKNPDFKDEDDKSSSSELEIPENSVEQLTKSILCKEDLLEDHVHSLEIHQTSASLPSSPIRFGAKQNTNNHNLHEEILKGRCKHLSPLMGRKSRDVLPPTRDFYAVDDPRLNNYETLEVFQKSQLKQKVRHRLSEPCPRHEQARTFTMHNKAPLWNETSQVYQLDFGGRVTQESAKNFQIELRGKQVMQFGRIENNAYTLDFQHPFTAVQAFAVALANVTQRLK